MKTKIAAMLLTCALSVMPVSALASPICGSNGNIDNPVGVGGGYILALYNVSKLPGYEFFHGSILWDTSHECPSIGAEYGTKTAALYVMSEGKMKNAPEYCELSSTITCSTYDILGANFAPHTGQPILGGCTGVLIPANNWCPPNLAESIPLDFDSGCRLLPNGECPTMPPAMTVDPNEESLNKIHGFFVGIPEPPVVTDTPLVKPLFTKIPDWSK